MVECNAACQPECPNYVFGPTTCVGIELFQLSVRILYRNAFVHPSNDAGLVYWNQPARLTVCPSVRPSIHEPWCSLCCAYSSGRILSILDTDDNWHERVCRTEWPFSIKIQKSTEHTFISLLWEQKWFSCHRYIYLCYHVIVIIDSYSSCRMEAVILFSLREY